MSKLIQEVKYFKKPVRDAWKKICPFFFVETGDLTENCVSVSVLIGEINENGRKLNLKMDAEDVVKHLSSHDPELVIDDLSELLK